MTRPRILDLFCGAGGAAVGYHGAGFEVVGVDIAPQPHYPFEFHRADAMRVLSDMELSGQDRVLGKFDAIHASPPCQAFTQMSAKYRGKGGKADSHPDLLTPTRVMLAAAGIPYVIENVVGARRKMRPTLTLHGGMFGLGVHRPRLFESNVLMMPPQMTGYTKNPIGVYGTKADGRVVWRNSMRADGSYGTRTIIRAARSIEEAREAMGIDWMDWEEIRESIPPAYTEWIGTHLLGALKAPA